MRKEKKVFFTLFFSFFCFFAFLQFLRLFHHSFSSFLLCDSFYAIVFVFLPESISEVL